MNNSQDVLRNEHIRFRITHQEVSNVKYEHPFFPVFSSNTNIKWNRLRKPEFIWDIKRPKTNRGKFESTCPHCGAKFEASLDSFEEIAKKNKMSIKIRSICRVISPIFLIILIIAFKTSGFFSDSKPLDLFGFFVLCSIFGFPISLIGAFTNPKPNIGIYYRGIESPQTDHDQHYEGVTHYINTIESY